MTALRYGCDSVQIDVTDPQRREDLAKAIERGINTWEGRPEWLVHLLEDLRATGDDNG